MASSFVLYGASEYWTVIVLSSYLLTFKESRNRFRQPMWHGGPVSQIGLSYRSARLGIDSLAA
jgi:hypothetical protein